MNKSKLIILALLLLGGGFGGWFYYWFQSGVTQAVSEHSGVTQPGPEHSGVTQPASEHNVSGWAWSENIGWISFNRTNCDTDDDGFSDGSAGCPPARTRIPNYGVDIDPTTGKFSGYAWSENIGWIRFDPQESYPTGPNYPDYSACLDIPGVAQGACDVGDWQVSGWIRACAGAADGINCSGGANPSAGGWDGWIKLGGANYGVWLDTTTQPLEFRGWAWGGGGRDTTGNERENRSVIGWISFNCSNQRVCPTSNYKVVTTFPVSLPPSATNLTRTPPDYCATSRTGAAAGIFSWTFNDPGDTQTAYQIQVDDNADFSSPVIDSGKIISGSNSYAPDQLLSYNTTYYWQLKVWDSKDLESDWIRGPSFTTPLHAYPLPDFTHSPQNPLVGEVVTFNDQSKCYNGGEHNCQDDANVTYKWDFGNNITSTQKGNATTTYDQAGDYTVRLKITDNTFSPSVSCIGIGDTLVKVQLPPPEWEEAPPF